MSPLPGRTSMSQADEELEAFWPACFVDEGEAPQAGQARAQREWI